MRYLLTLLLVSGCASGGAGTAGRDPDLLSASDGGLPDLTGQPPRGDGFVPPDDLFFSSDAFWAEDPPPMFCALDGGTPPKVPGGTPQCPDDKNREGCPCTKAGETVPCWPGLRVNRGLGQCMDGTTTCQMFGELGLAWGPCKGYVLPTPGATGGRAACKCFSGGTWKIDNLSPCFYGLNPPGSGGAVSTINGNCPGMFAKPAEPWSANTVTVDCVGRFKLCYTLKAGDANNPMPNDCVLTEVCTEADYVQANVAQPFPPLPSWITNDTACSQKFAQSGYGEMSVDGVSLLCDKVKKVFNRVRYCPLKCSMQGNENLPECKNCMQGGGGNF
jgi:hypothetical protein